MATADRHIGDLNVELTKGQGRSIKLTSLLTNTSTTVGQWTAVAGANGSQAPTCTEDSGSLLVSWSDSQATASIGRVWRLRLDGDDVAGGRVVEARPQATPGTASVAIQVDPLSEVTTTVVVTPAGPTGATGATGAPGADGADAVYSDATPAALGTAAPGTADLAAREGHVHPMPSAQDVGAVTVDAVGLLPGERNRGHWDIAATYAAGDVVYDYYGDGQVYVAVAPSTGEQPSLGLGSWTLVASAGRGIAIGPAAAASDTGVAIGMGGEAPGIRGVSIGTYGRTSSDDLATNVGSSGYAFGTNSTNVGAFGQAYGTGATNVGVYGGAGTGGTNVGAESSAYGDGAVALGHNQHADGNGDVAIAGLIVGHVTDPLGTPVPDGLTLTPGFADLPETTDATDPAADHQRLVARTDGIYVRDDTGTEIGPLISEASLPALTAGDGIDLTPVGDTLVVSTQGPVTPAAIGAAETSHTHAGADITSGTVAAARLGSGTANSTTYLRGDQTWATVAGGGAAGPPAIPYISGEYRGLAGASKSSAFAALTSTGLLAAQPLWMEAGAYKRIGVITTAVGTATYRFGVYPMDPVTMSPAGQSLIVDCGTLSMAATPGLLEITTTITIPTSGIYYLAILVDAYTSSPTIHGYAGDVGALPMLPFKGVRVSTNPAGRGQWAALRYGVTTGAMPASFPVPTLWGDQMPLIYVRCN